MPPCLQQQQTTPLCITLKLTKRLKERHSSPPNLHNFHQCVEAAKCPITQIAFVFASHKHHFQSEQSEMANHSNKQALSTTDHSSQKVSNQASNWQGSNQTSSWQRSKQTSSWQAKYQKRQQAAGKEEAKAPNKQCL